MPEIFASNLLPVSSQNICRKSSHWLDSGAFEKDRIMTSLNLSHDYPDIDEILDVGDPDDLVSGRLEPVSLNVYDDSYIEDLSHLCSENSEITQQHYQSKIDFQGADEFSRPNEEGLLEALQRSMENFECSTMSDLASLTASLGINFPGTDFSSPSSTDELFADQLPLDDHSSSTGTDDTTPLQSPEEEELVSVDEQTDMDEEKTDSNESMLKQLLLNPSNDYRKEVDAIGNRVEHVEKLIGNSGNSRETRRQIRKIKKKKLPKKPFTELLKHLESTNTTIPQVCSNRTKPKTRILNAKSYMRQYGSAPASRANSPDPGTTVSPAKKATSKSASQKSKNSRNNIIIPKKPLQVTKIYPISQSPVTTLQLDRKNENMIVAPDLDSLLDMFESEAAKNLNITTSKKDAEPLTFRPSADKRKGTVLIEPLPKKRPRNTQEDSEKKAKSGSDVVGLCYEKPSSDHDYCEKQATDSQNGLLSAKGESTTTTTKVVQWEEYLQRVRSGTRSEPNSPITSPKPLRGESRKEKTAKSVTDTNKSANVTNTKSCQRSSSKKKISSKPTIKLQEFQEYLANLKNKQEKKTASAETISPAITEHPKNTLKLIQPSSPITVSLSSGMPMVQQTKPITLTQPFIQVKSGGKIHTATVTSSQTGSHQATPFVMIRIPAQSNASSVANAASLPQTCPISVTKAASPTLVFPVGKTPVINVPSKPLASTPVPSANVSKPKRVSKSKQTITANAPQTRKEAKNPTFKLMTSSQGKSLILSNVTGQLREVLTALAQQQQQQGTSSSQQKTLQKLLATITNMKKKQPEETGNTNSILVTSCGTRTTAIPASHISKNDISSSPLQSCKSGLESSDNSISILINATKNTEVVCKKHSDQISHFPSSGQDFENVHTAPQRALINVPHNNVKITYTQTNSCQKSDSSTVKSKQSPVNHYVKSVIKMTVDKLLDRVVANCDAAAGAADTCNDVNSNEKSSLRSLTFTDALSQNSHHPLNVVSSSNQETQTVECDGNILDKHLEHSMPTTNAGETFAVDQYYNKLPAYLYSGKLLQKNADKVEDETVSNNIEYNKLPHYFCSGKLAPSEETILHGSIGHMDIGMEQEIGFTTEVKCTPEGKVIDPEQTFYSRLPSYYGYGRTHVVDTVTDPPSLQSDETVTKQSLDQHQKERNQVQKSEERSNKRRQKQSERISGDRIMYSKIPSYLLSGRQPLARERRLSEMSSLSESSDSEGATSTSGRRRYKRLKKSFHDREAKLQKQKEDEAKNQAIVQRRVMYVGGINEATNKPYLRARFEKFGAIDDITLYFRKGKDNYAFVTFRYGNDVIQAIEHGNDNVEPKFTLCFGGRRHFCKVAYADLDDKGGKNDDELQEDFDTLLQRAMRR